MSHEVVVFRDDVEYLIDVAEQLSSAIERQIRFIESSLKIMRDRFEAYSASTEFKERLICAVTSFNSSLGGIVQRLDASNR